MQNNRIAQLRKLKVKLGLSYDTLAHELGVHTFTAYRWLQKGVVPRSLLALRAIDQFLENNAGKIRRKRHRIGQRSYSKARKTKLQ